MEFELKVKDIKLKYENNLNQEDLDKCVFNTENMNREIIKDKKLINKGKVRDIFSSVSDEEILKLIHLNKRKKLPFFFEEYLTDRFIKLNDIRYFNEFLCIYNKKKLIEKNKRIFKKRYNDKIFKYSYDKRLKYCLNYENQSIVLSGL